MLVTFVSNAHENITMFGDVAVRLIKMMGHSGTVPSAILAADIPNALDRLKRALAHELPEEADSETGSEEDEYDSVDITKRAYPLITMLQDAAKANCNVMWRVD